jgi:hypothetical protein
MQQNQQTHMYIVYKSICWCYYTSLKKWHINCFSLWTMHIVKHTHHVLKFSNSISRCQQWCMCHIKSLCLPSFLTSIFSVWQFTRSYMRSSSAARLWNGYCQEKTKQDAKTCKLRDNRGNAHYSYGCYGGNTHLPSSTRFSGSGWGKICCTSTLESAMLALPSPQLRAQQNIDAASGVRSHV